MQPAVSGGCFAVGDLLGTSHQEGEQSGTALFGKAVESPIVRDYIQETHGVGSAGLPLALLLDCDWWDSFVGAKGKNSYFDFLGRHHPKLSRKALDGLNPEPARPDILTCLGPATSRKVGELSRNEYFEIKPDSPTGLEKWFGPPGAPELGKRSKLRKFYRSFLLPYREGVVYPNTPTKSKELPLPLNQVFRHLVRAFMRNHGVRKVRLYISVRLHSPGLLLYKICIEIETDDKRRQEALARATGKWLYAAYVVCHFPELFPAIESELGEHSFEGEPFPRIRCQFNVLPELKPVLGSLEQAVMMRGLALPGEQFLLCCDESFYQWLVAKPPEIQVRKLWAEVQARAESWVKLAGGEALWSRVRPLILEVEQVARNFALMFPDAEDFVNAVLSWVTRHPLLTLGIVVTGVVITAGVAAYLEAALVGAALVASEGAIAEGTAAGAASALGRFALTEEIAAPLFGPEVASATGARGFMTATEISTQIGGVGVPANDGLILANAVSRPLLSTAQRRVAAAGVAAAAVLMVSSSSAYAMERGATVVDPKRAPIVAQHAAGLYMIRSQDPATYRSRPPVQGSPINVHDYAEPASRTAPDFSGRPPPLLARYVGSLKVI
ncbi:hypothetical protein [Kineosporia sp. R_H_3]|uniref:hypothetical protein n=1 Tax=Kineosporia sp. R_H_3 TaxID=1961848 RepID=UPI00117BD49A|nr:hypothetical protein [Kineosporia sp. R_H_3]